MRFLFLIPARGGSKRLPGKNLKLLGGIPLVGRAARLARLTAGRLVRHDCQIVCSTDNKLIATAAHEWGAEVPFMRPAELAADDTAGMDVVFHALAVLGSANFDAVVLLQPTSPFTAPEDVLGAINLYEATGAPVVSVCQAEHPASWQFGLDHDGLLQPILTDILPARSQDAPILYRLNGAVYVASPEQLRESNGFIGKDTRAYVMPVNRSVDIDTELDIEVAEGILSSFPVLPINVAGHSIGQDQPCFIIAEAGVNHNGNIDLAMRLVDAAADAGANAVKFQTFKTERVVSRQAPKAEYQQRTTSADESQFDMIKRLELSKSDHLCLIDHCRRRQILFLSTPFDEESADLLAALDVPAFKVPSGEITNLQLLAHIARKGRPMIVSTGMSSLREVDTAIDIIRGAGQTNILLLHCVSNYPAAAKDINLRAMSTMRLAFGVPVGYSDHTEGDEVPLAAVSLGASVLEKHFTLDRTLPGPDHQASIQPEGLKALVQRVRRVEAALGHGRKEPVPSEAETALVARKSLFSSCCIPAGSKVTENMITTLRPGTGLSPSYLKHLIGRIARVDIRESELLSLDMFE